MQEGMSALMVASQQGAPIVMRLRSKSHVCTIGANLSLLAMERLWIRWCVLGHDMVVSV